MSMIILSVVLTVVVAGGVAFVTWRIFAGMGQANAKEQRILQTGMPAEGQILGIQPSGTSMTVSGHRHVEVLLTLEVRPQNRPPYQANLQKMISEFQIPQLVPGTPVQLRVDPADPANVAIAELGTGRQPGHFGGTHAPVAGLGTGGIGMAPNVANTAKKAIVSSLVGAVGISLMIGVFLAYQFGYFDAFGSGGDDICERVYRCCLAGAEGNPTAAAACENWRDSIPRGCEMALEGYEQSAVARGRTCE